jgi:uncharacterized membrane protein
MTGLDRHIFRQFRLGLIALAPILIVAALLVFFPPDGNERTTLLQFIGRFHVLAIHFPIALILVVPILELAGRSERFSYLRLSVGFVLGLATLGAITAAILGWCLGFSGGYSGPLITQHMWGGIALAGICWLCWILRTQTKTSVPPILYSVALAAGVALVAWTGYRGGQLSMGVDHLTEHMPLGMRHALRISNSDAAALSGVDATTFYGARVHPILAARCVSCHGSSKQKANLRLDTYKGMMRGGKDGLVVQAGNAQSSDLFRRISLPANHDDFMPKGKRPLSSDEVKVIELWIAAGASNTLPLEAIKDAPAGSGTPAVAEVVFSEIDAAAVTRLRAADASAVAQLQKQFPNILDYESRGSADLRLNASVLGAKFGDSDLAAFAPVAGIVTAADFSRTAITDRSANTIASMKSLRSLRFAHTGITDATLLRLGALDQLESLNVFDTHVTTAAVPTMAKLPKLAHLYAGQTAIPPGNPIPNGLTGKLVF